MKRIFDVIYNLNTENLQIFESNKKDGDLDEYILDLIQQSENSKTKKMYKFESNKVEVYTLVIEIFQSQFDQKIIKKNTHRIAERLIEKERAVQERYKNLMDLQKGILVQSVFQNGEDFLFLIAKIENEEYIDNVKFQKEIGLPFDNRILKTCLMKVSKNQSASNEYDFDQILLADSNERIASYWSSNFLGLTELHTDEFNTKQAFKYIEREIARSTRYSPPDQLLLLNEVVGYFEKQKSFSIEKLIDRIFGHYKPVDNAVNMHELTISIKQLPKQKGFDSPFHIAKDVVTSRRVLKVNDHIEIVLNGYIDKLRQTIFAKEDSGNQYVCIKTDEGEVYRAFNY